LNAARTALGVLFLAAVDCGGSHPPTASAASSRDEAFDGRTSVVAESPDAPDVSPNTVVRFTPGMVRPRLLSHPAPTYTREAFDARVGGIALIRCVINLDGTLEQCRIVKGLPHMDEALLESVSQWTYTPVFYKGHPQRVEMVIPVRVSPPGARQRSVVPDANLTIRTQIHPGAQRCFEYGLALSPHDGRLVIRVEVGPEGDVDSADVSVNDGISDGVASCVLTVAENAHFSPPGPQGATVAIPLDFRTNGAVQTDAGAPAR
jgi:TonB family protein